MLRSIRHQILVPLIAVQGVAVATLAVTAATLAARRSEQQIVGRLNDVIDTLGHSNFPYTPSVLSKMRGLSGAHFAVYDEHGRVTDATLPMSDALAAWAPTVPTAVAVGFARNVPDFAFERNALFHRPLAHVERNAGVLAARALSGNELATGALGGRGVSVGCRVGHARRDGGAHGLDRPSHQPSHSRSPTARRPHRRRRRSRRLILVRRTTKCATWHDRSMKCPRN